MLRNPIGISMAQWPEIMMVTVHVDYTAELCFDEIKETTIVPSGDLLVASAGYR